MIKGCKLRKLIKIITQSLPKKTLQSEHKNIFPTAEKYLQDTTSLWMMRCSQVHAYDVVITITYSVLWLRCCDVIMFGHISEILCSAVIIC